MSAGEEAMDIADDSAAPDPFSGGQASEPTPFASESSDPLGSGNSVDDPFGDDPSHPFASNSLEASSDPFGNDPNNPFGADASNSLDASSDPFGDDPNNPFDADASNSLDASNDPFGDDPSPPFGADASNSLDASSDPFATTSVHIDAFTFDDAPVIRPNESAPFDAADISTASPFQFGSAAIQLDASPFDGSAAPDPLQLYGFRGGCGDASNAGSMPASSGGSAPLPHRFKAGTVALQEIRTTWTPPARLIHPVPFTRIVRDIFVDELKTSCKLQSSALAALQEAAEAYMIGFFEDANLAAIFSKRITILPRDLYLSYRLRAPPKRRDHVFFNPARETFLR